MMRAAGRLLRLTTSSSCELHPDLRAAEARLNRRPVELRRLGALLKRTHVLRRPAPTKIATGSRPAVGASRLQRQLQCKRLAAAAFTVRSLATVAIRDGCNTAPFSRCPVPRVGSILFLCGRASEPSSQQDKNCTRVSKVVFPATKKGRFFWVYERGWVGVWALAHARGAQASRPANAHSVYSSKSQLLSSTHAFDGLLICRKSSCRMLPRNGALGCERQYAPPSSTAGERTM
jgi:hypothetical protein